MSENFSNRRVLVAGASSGIGKAIARRFAEQGAKTRLGARQAEKLERVVRELSSAGDVIGVPGDYADAAKIEALLAKTGPLDVLVVCYGETDTPPGFDTTDDNWERLIDANLSGPARLARVTARSMKARGSGVILFIGSICGHEELGAPIAYTAGKTALRAVIKAMARELGPHGVRVNMISPGNVIFDGGRWAAKRDANPVKIEQMLNSAVPMRRFGTPNDIAEAALFLCSERASFITGADLVCDGGQTIAI